MFSPRCSLVTELEGNESNAQTEQGHKSAHRTGGGGDEKPWVGSILKASGLKIHSDVLKSGFKYRADSC